MEKDHVLKREGEMKIQEMKDRRVRESFEEGEIIAERDNVGRIRNGDISKRGRGVLRTQET